MTQEHLVLPFAPGETLAYDNGILSFESVPLSEMAERFGTPLYIYSSQALEYQYRKLTEAFSSHPVTICYSAKANTTAAILKHINTLGCGFDVNSGGELLRVLRVGVDPQNVVMSGVGKRKDEIELALQQQVKFIKAESIGELELIDRIAGRLGLRAPIALRINPNVDAKTHPYISTALEESKFGFSWEQAVESCRFASHLPHCELMGLDMHIGSQITETGPFVDAVAKMLDLSRHLEDEGISITEIDLGGGMGISYDGKPVMTAREFADAILPMFQSTNLHITIEPGRYFIGGAGILLTEVLYKKDTTQKSFVIVDAGMNDFVRPSLYGAYHEIIPVRLRPGDVQVVDIVGPVCESTDRFAADRPLAPVVPQDLLAITGTGAYGYVMSSNYNSRSRPAEVFIEDHIPRLIRRRESVEDFLISEMP